MRGVRTSVQVSPDDGRDEPGRAQREQQRDTEGEAGEAAWLQIRQVTAAGAARRYGLRRRQADLVGCQAGLHRRRPATTTARRDAPAGTSGSVAVACRQLHDLCRGWAAAPSRQARASRALELVGEIDDRCTSEAAG